MFCTHKPHFSSVAPLPVFKGCFFSQLFAERSKEHEKYGGDPDQPHKLHIVTRVKSVMRRPYWEKELVKHLGLQKVRSFSNKVVNRKNLCVFSDALKLPAKIWETKCVSLHILESTQTHKYCVYVLFCDFNKSLNITLINCRTCIHQHRGAAFLKLSYSICPLHAAYIYNHIFNKQNIVEFYFFPLICSVFYSGTSPCNS